MANDGVVALSALLGVELAGIERRGATYVVTMSDGQKVPCSPAAMRSQGRLRNRLAEMALVWPTRLSAADWQRAKQLIEECAGQGDRRGGL